MKRRLQKCLLWELFAELLISAQSTQMPKTTGNTACWLILSMTI
jgi:hypothetical protein